MSDGTIIHRRIHFHARDRRKVLSQDSQENSILKSNEARIPHVTRLMALAIHLQNLVDSGQLTNYSTLAAVGHVSRARITQILNLTLLAPDIQEAILFLPAVERGPDRITERDLRPIAAEMCWPKQREMWAKL